MATVRTLASWIPTAMEAEGARYFAARYDAEPTEANKQAYEAAVRQYDEAVARFHADAETIRQMVKTLRSQEG